MEIEKSKVLIQFLRIFRQSGDVLFFLYARRLRGYTATSAISKVVQLKQVTKLHLFEVKANKVQLVRITIRNLSTHCQNTLLWTVRDSPLEKKLHDTPSLVTKEYSYGSVIESLLRQLFYKPCRFNFKRSCSTVPYCITIDICCVRATCQHNFPGNPN